MSATLDARIRGDIERRIRSGAWKPGHRIPFEHELAAHYGCARATVSKAMTALARAGLIERRRRAGSFVAHPHVQSAVLDVPDIGRMIAERGDAYRFALLKRRVGKQAIEIEGVHFAAGEPFGHEARTIELAAVPEARDVDFAVEAPGSWLLGHVPWSDARHRITAVGAAPRIARALGLSIGAPCLQVERWTWRQGAAITWARQTFPGDRYDLVAEFTPGSR